MGSLLYCESKEMRFRVIKRIVGILFPLLATVAKTTKRGTVADEEDKTWSLKTLSTIAATSGEVPSEISDQNSYFQAGQMNEDRPQVQWMFGLNLDVKEQERSVVHVDGKAPDHEE